MRVSKIMPSLTVAAIAACTAQLAGCSGTSESPDAASGTGGGAASALSGGTGGRASGGSGAGGMPAATPEECVDTTPAAASACSTLDNDADAIPFTASTDDPPSPAGGTIASGTYQLMSATWYGKDADCNAAMTFTQPMVQTTIQIDASALTLQSVSHVCAAGMAATGRSHGHFTAGDMGGSGSGDVPWPFRYSASSDAGCAPEFNLLNNSLVSFTATAASLTFIAHEDHSSCGSVPGTYVEVYTRR